MRSVNFFSIKLLLGTVVLAIFIGIVFVYANSEKAPIKPTKSFQIKQGINLNEWLEAGTLDSIRIDTLVTHEKILLLKEFGFDHVRIPISEANLFDENLNYRLNVKNILIDRTDFCIKNGLKVIIDLHKTRNHTFEREDNQLFESDLEIKKFLKIWEKLQNAFSNYSTDSLAYECLNEPAAPDKKHFLWNNVINPWISFIREKEPKRVLFVGSNRGNQTWTFKYLDIPLNDSNLVLTLHYYRPSLFTHYKAPWGKYAFYKGPIHYPGKLLTEEEYKQLPDSLQSKFQFTQENYGKDYISKEVQTVVQFAQKYNLPINLGEFGCLRTMPDSLRYQWFKDIVDVMKEYNISYTLWGMNGAGFGIWDNKRNLDTLMLQTLKLK